MINRMKIDIARVNNAKIGKDILKNTIGAGYIWLLVWFINETQKSYLIEKIALFFMLFAILCGCITSIIVRKDKKVFILFRAISIWSLSLGFLLLAYTSYYVFLKFRSSIFLCVTLCFYIIIFISMLIIFKNKVKPKGKIKEQNTNINKKVLLSSTIFFIIGFFLIGPIIKQSSQFTMHVVVICLGILLSYIIVASSSYYLVEYMVSKNYMNSQKSES